MDASHSTKPHHSKNNAFTFHGKAGEYFSIWLVNLLLTIITLGVYSAWATVRNKRYFYGNLELDGDRFDYHARPMQILLGRLLALAIIIIAYVTIVVFPLYGAAILLILVLFLPWVIIRSWRYDAIMSSYRGVRFNYECRTGRAYWVLLGFPVLALFALVVLYQLSGMAMLTVAGGNMAVIALLGVIVTFTFFAGIIALSGIGAAMRFDLYVNNMFFGNQKFTAILSKKKFIKMAFWATAIFVPFILLIIALVALSFGSLLAAPEDLATLASVNVFLIFIIYLLVLVAMLFATSYLAVAQRNYVFSQTTLCNGQLALHSSMDVASFLGLVITNSLLIIFTLGLGSAAAHVRYARYMAAHTHIEGDMTLASVNAHTDNAGVAVAEEMVQALDLNLGM